jgi:hypothetical protein
VPTALSVHLSLCNNGLKSVVTIYTEPTAL